MTDTLIAPDATAGNPHNCSVPAAPTPTLLEARRANLFHRRGKTWSKDLLKALIAGTRTPLDELEARLWTTWDKTVGGDGPTCMCVYRYLMQKFVHVGFTVTAVGRHVQFDNYPSIGGQCVSIAELVLYPATDFDGRINRAETRQASIARRSQKRGPYTGTRRNSSR